MLERRKLCFKATLNEGDLDFRSSTFWASALTIGYSAKIWKLSSSVLHLLEKDFAHPKGQDFPSLVHTPGCSYFAAPKIIIPESSLTEHTWCHRHNCTPSELKHKLDISAKKCSFTALYVKQNRFQPSNSMAFWALISSSSQFSFFWLPP